MKKAIFSRILPEKLAWTSRAIMGLLIIWMACETVPALLEHYVPSPDFDEQESTLICWNPVHKNVLVPLISKISQTDHVTLFYNENYHRPEQIVAQFYGHGANLQQILMSPFRLEKDNIWIRDYGPSFVKDARGNVQIVGFEYPHEEYADYVAFSGQYARRMKLPFLRSKLRSTGGGREINGKGTIILIEGYEREINPDLSKEEIEKLYKSQFNQKKVIWLKRGIPQDDFPGYGPVIDNIFGTGANWHIDEFCRFVDAKTLLLAQVDSSDLARDPFYQLINERLEENYRILSESRDQDGQPFRIIRIPQAPVIFAAGKQGEQSVIYTPVTSYLNFVITNKLIIMPAYFTDDDPEYISVKDQHAKQVLENVFPTREVIPFDATTLNYKGGGLHCITLARPKSVQ